MDLLKDASRRRLVVSGLSGLVAAAATPAFAQTPKTVMDGVEAGPAMNWDHFLTAFRPEAIRLLKEKRVSPESYIRRLSSEVVSVSGIPDVALKPIPWMRPEMRFAVLAPGVPFMATQWAMDPGAQQPCHNHPNASVCTLVTHGELLIENFEMDGSSDAPKFGERVVVRLTRRERLVAGRTSVLTHGENNLHRLTAGPQGARGIDLNTLHGTQAPFGYLRLTPMSEGFESFEGTWYDPSV